MPVFVEVLKNPIQTGRKIYKCASKWEDLGDFVDSPLLNWFNYLRRIPYKEDPETVELVARPKYLLDPYYFTALDCKKKAVLSGAWLEGNEVIWRLIACSERPDKSIHHVFTQARIDGVWRNIDPTYSNYRLFDGKPEITYAKELPR